MRRRLLLLALLVSALCALVWCLFGDDDGPVPEPGDSAPAAAVPRPGSPSASRSEGAAASPARRAAPVDASPVAGPTDAGDPRAKLQVTLELDPPVPFVVAAVVSVFDAEGNERRVDASSAGPVLIDDLATGRAVVRAESRGWSAEVSTIELTADSVARLSILLTRVGRLTGVVRDPHGEPVAGADIVAISEVDGTRGLDLAIAGADGRYAIDGLPSGASVTLRARAEGWADSLAFCPSASAADGQDATCDIVLRPGASLAVRVLDPSGEQFEANVVVGESGATHYDAARREHVATGLPAERCIVTAWSPTCPPVEASAYLVAGERTEIEIRLASGVEVAGVVVDPTGAPLVGANVCVARPFAKSISPVSANGITSPRQDVPRRIVVIAPAPAYPPLVTSTDVSGAFRFVALRPGPYDLMAAKDGGTSVRTRVDAPAAGVRLVVAPPTRVRFRLAPAMAGTWIANVAAGECPPETTPNAALDRGTVGVSARGRVAPDRVLECVVRPDARAVFICSEGTAPLVLSIAPEVGGVIDLGEIRLDPGFSLRGRVVRSNGKRLPDAEVRAMGTGPASRCVAPDENGEFVMEHLAAGPVILRASASGRLGAAEAIVSAETPLVTLRAPVTGRLRGKIVGGDGKPLANVYFTVRHDLATSESGSGTTLRLSTAKDGTFAADVASGRVLLTLGAETTVRDVPEAGEVVVDLVKR